MLDPHYDFMRRYRYRNRKPVRHQQTCPVCGRKPVNTYLRNGVWKCRRCWEEAQKGEVVDPIGNYQGTPLEGLDAFQRQLKRFDIPSEKIDRTEAAEHG